ncbi:MAG TPA: VWA domain-containing protein [Myxococcales bacterium]|nr:VWA domain-containing protein [Myxococcales bacterium]
MNGDLVHRVLGLCRALRERGMMVTTGHAIDAVRALRFGALESRERTWLTLRCVLVGRPEEMEIFDEVFAELFADEEPAKEGPVRVTRRSPPREEAGAPSLSSWSEPGEGAEGDESEEVPAASDAHAVVDKDFSSFGTEELDEIRRIASRIARRLAARPSRRWKSGRRGPRVDLRRTLRRTLSNGGEALDLRFRRRRPRKTRIVALCDVSGSMDLYSRFLLQFLYALQGTVARVESFVFSTTLRRVTDLLSEPDYALALRGLSAEVHDWSGGTRIGACIAEFNRDHPELVDGRTVTVILSDGWDTGDPATLGEEMEVLKLRSRKVIWLNPLLGSPGYEPLTQGMQAALPHVSVFAPAHNLAALRALERHLLA